MFISPSIDSGLVDKLDCPKNKDGLNKRKKRIGGENERMNAKRVRMIAAITVALMIAVACLLLAIAKPIPECDPATLKDYPDKDYDKDGYSNIEESGKIPTYEDLSGIGIDPCDPCKPDPGCDACLVQQGHCIEYLYAIHNSMPVYGKKRKTNTSDIYFQIRCRGDYLYDWEPKIGILNLPKKLVVNKPMKGTYIIPTRKELGAYEEVVITITPVDHGLPKSVTIYFENKAKDVLERKIVQGRCSHFGGEDDLWIDRGLRKEFYNLNPPEYATTFEKDCRRYFKDKDYNEDFNRWMNDPEQKVRWNKTALSIPGKKLYGRELDTEKDYYCAMRWPPYSKQGRDSKKWLRNQRIKVTNKVTGASVIVEPVDYGPAVWTKKDIDLSRRAMDDIGATTGSKVEISLDYSNAKLGLVRASFFSPMVKEIIKHSLPLIVGISAIVLVKLLAMYLETRKATHKKRRR